MTDAHLSPGKAGLPEIPDDDADFTPELARKIIAKYHELLANPTAVHLNMLRGGIAKPSWDQIKHLYPEQFVAPAQRTLPPDHVAVPQAALDWLFGEKPDANGKWFGDCKDDACAPGSIFPGKYWWRSKFRALAFPSTQCLRPGDPPASRCPQCPVSSPNRGVTDGAS